MITLHMNQIIPGNSDENKGYLFIGSYKAATDHLSLRRNGVNFILSLVDPAVIKNDMFEDIKYHFVNIRDHPRAPIENHFSECYNFIKKGLKEGNVLVHCYSGISRSVAIIIMYLMKSLNIPYQGALEIVKVSRIQANPNNGFVSKLRDYDDLLEVLRNEDKKML